VKRKKSNRWEGHAMRLGERRNEVELVWKVREEKRDGKERDQMKPARIPSPFLSQYKDMKCCQLYTTQKTFIQEKLCS
jgi:hypothetical protein